MGLVLSDYNTRQIIMSVIQLSGVYWGIMFLEKEARVEF